MSDHLPFLLQHALRGWQLFPLKFRDKQPLLDDWPHKATNDEEQIRLWQKRFPHCNWAAVTGPPSEMFVLDVDGDERINGLRSAAGGLIGGQR